MKDVWFDKLSANEFVQQEFGVSKRYLKIGCISLIVFGIILLPVFGIGIFLILLSIISWFGIPYQLRYAITNERVLLLNRWTKEKFASINLSQVTDVKVTASFIEKMLYHTGTLVIETAGKDSEVAIKNIDNPYALLQRLNTLRDAARR